MDRYGFSGDIPVLLGGLGVRVVGEETKNNRYAIIYRYIIDIESGLFQTWREAVTFFRLWASNGDDRDDGQANGLVRSLNGHVATLLAHEA